MSNYVPRLIDRYLDEMLAEVSAVLIVGPRACGKTTTGLRRATSSFRLGQAAQASAVANDPDAAIAGVTAGTLLIDEWQVVPEVLGAVKRAVDEGAVPAGRFILTGSTRADLRTEGWPATGRILRVPLWGVCQREFAGNVAERSPIDVFFEDEMEQFRSSSEAPGVHFYVDAALRSGFPEAARISSDRVRRAWMTSYVDQLVLRDASAAGEERDPLRLRRYLRAVAASTAGVVSHKTIYDAAGVTRVTAAAYDGLLDLLYIVEQVPAWTTSRLSQLNQTPKRYLIDPALLGPLWQVDARAVLRDGDLMGRLIDTFVAAQIRAECVASESAPTMHHLRRSDGRHEVDLILEGPAGRVVAIEVKASSVVDLAAARHLVWLRDSLGDQFVTGIVFHTGPFAYRMDDRIWALPIACLWRERRG